MPRAERATRSLLLALVLGLPFVALVVRPLPGLGARVESPHGKFKGECGDCHSAEAWKPARPGKNFDHSKFGFALTGAHAATACRDCHASLDFSKPEMRCASCHADPHRGELGLDCERCHTARSFLDPAGMRRMHQLTSFPLVGSHAGVDCESCHRPAAQGQMQWVNTRAECDACHEADYNATQSPAHLASGFPRDCARCHGPRAWSPARFDHDATPFPLTGAHRRTACGSCHGDGVYRGKDTACVSCHRTDYDGTTGPPHAAAAFGTACATCHTTESWNGATFDHGATAFPLTGAHVGAPCSSCHGDGVYRGKDTACVSCHRADYDGTANPSHAASGFSTDCASCHTTATWAGATFDHDTRFFPIYSGRHAGLWPSCATCHNQPSSYAAFTCFSCHPHSDKVKTDGNHSSVAGYVYDSVACYQCHPRGVH
jgi:hypothetical protein